MSDPLETSMSLAWITNQKCDFDLLTKATRPWVDRALQRDAISPQDVERSSEARP